MILEPIFCKTETERKTKTNSRAQKDQQLYLSRLFLEQLPNSTLYDAAPHPRDQELFPKVDCSQAYHCLQMADDRSMELLTFDFASCKFAYKSLAQGLDQSLSAFSSFIRE